MAVSLPTHLTVLERSAALYKDTSAFQLPVIDPSGQVSNWTPVSYARFQLDVDDFARYWLRVLKADGVAPRSVVGLWLSGMTYTDVLHVYGLSRAGYIPQLFSVRLPNPKVVYELLGKAKARALIYERTFKDILAGCPVPTHEALDYGSAVPTEEDLPLLHAGVRASDPVFIFHTSGSTSGSPKLVPCSFTWLASAIKKCEHIMTPIKASEKRDVTIWMGSISHIGQSFMLLGAMQHGTCTIQPSKIAFDADELSLMVNKCGLNRLNQFATFLATNLVVARSNPKVAAIMQSFDEVLYSGLPLAVEEEKWAYQNGVRLRNLFGSTEIGAMLRSVGDGDRRLEPLPGTCYEFRPLPAPSASESGAQASTAQLLELIILSNSPDCPDPTLRSSQDGHFHTGDLFIENKGKYVSMGRNDDWIKSENSLRCDTKAIQDNVLETCDNLVRDCVVVGQGRPSPVLFVEATEMGARMGERLKREILRRTRAFHSRRYLHERIVDSRMIVIVENGSLPRTATKGNIQRQKTEEMYKQELDTIFRASP
ncbi:unnamed protein product [Peniophora sp. CBMAI 1063]|nr:unnamed protein product [Peniophora sp. CBMAI 1063]